MMYAKNEKEIREWILDGLPKRLKAEESSATDHPLLKMPAYRGKVAGRDFEDLVAYFKAVAWAENPSAPEATEGREVALAHGCFGCHGPEGRGSISDPGSLKGYIPGWDAADFRDLVRNDDELKQWVMNGVSDRFKKNPAAQVFLQRAPLKMPAYRGKLSEGDYAKVKAYIHWLQKKR